MKKLISVCVLCYNEEKNVAEMAFAISEQMKKLDEYDYEIIFSDNASTDLTPVKLRKLAAEDERIKVIINNRNFGTRRSGINCMAHAKGDAVISIPCDFQDPPELIPEFVKEWENGHKIVCGQKTSSEESKIKYLLRTVFYNIIDYFSDIKQYKHIAGITLNDREIINQVLEYGLDIAYRNLIAELGYEPKLIEYKQRKRREGKSSYNLFRYLDFALSSMVTTSVVPIRVATISGCLMSFLSFMFGIIYFIYKLIYWRSFPTGVAPMVIGVFFLGSVQILFVGLIGEYIGILLKRTTKLPIVVEKELINISCDLENDEK